MSKIIVIGSSNTDLIATMKRFPMAGETLQGRSFLQAMGGKGGNQAMSAHKLGGDVQFISCLGTDENGRNTLTYYTREQLDVSKVLLVENAASGTAMIWVDDNGENSIVINPGANMMLSPEYVCGLETEIANAAMVVVQLEIPYETVQKICGIAVKNKTKILLNAAPAGKIDRETLKRVDYLVVNETEAEIISGVSLETFGQEEVLDKLLAMGAKAVILTLGEKGCLFKTRQTMLYSPAFVVDAKDTTAAGDVFCGALAVELCRETDWETALTFASAASALCVTRIGAQPSIPTEEEVRDFLRKKGRPNDLVR
ncbi:ribokinase [Flagellimonas iocasae]|uniref:Ribokinase n=1 Tax=Flagellimonas iocasae TaxID=2055905 RepID=A0ABW4Y1J9_9FLAO